MDVSEDQGHKKVGHNRQVGIFAGIMAMGTFLSRILGFLRDMALAAVFDIHTKDAFVLAMRLPNLFRRLLGEGALSMAFIPVFSGMVHQDQELEAKRFSAAVFSLLTLFLSLIVVLAILYMDVIIGYWASGSGFTQVPGKLDLTISMARWMFGFLFFICCYAFFMAILNTFGRYAMGALAPAFFNIVLIAAFLLPTDLSLQGHAHGVAVAVLLGGVVQMLVLLPQVWKSGYLPRLTFRFRVQGMKPFFTAFLGGLVGTGVYQLTALINSHFASDGEGYVSWLYFGDRLLELPLSLVSVSLGAALLPTLSGFWSQGDIKGFLKMANRFLRVNYFMAVPCAVGLYILSDPIVEVLFLRGQFTLNDAKMVASVVQVYALTILVASGVRVLIPSFYAIKKPLVPAAVGGVCLVFHLLWTPALMQTFGVQGLALATALTTALNLLFLLFFFHYHLGSLELAVFFKSLAKFSISAAVMGFVIQSYDFFLTYVQGIWLGKTFLLLLVIALGALSYFVTSYLLKTDECTAVVRTLLRRRPFK